ncbi:hypothetical protein K439DRAFT_1621821 [Ramaria rubella]|nr:hypothetical protein K439DRAFT_1621821 [Ramaria rubella]
MNAIVGPVRYGGGEGQREAFQKPFSEKTGEMLDNEVRKMINLAHIQTTELLTEKHSSVEKVAQQLIEKEVLTCLSNRDRGVKGVKGPITGYVAGSGHCMRA